MVTARDGKVTAHDRQLPVSIGEFDAFSCCSTDPVHASPRQCER
jgi:hypothetical protein